MEIGRKEGAHRRWRALLGGIVVVVLLVAWYAYVSDPYRGDQRLVDEIIAAHKQDAVGGKTPEETLDLFAAALRRRDVDRAAQYFLLEKQDEMRALLRAGLTSGGVDLLLSVFEKELVGAELFEGYYQFNTYDDKGVAEFGFDVVFDDISGVWKLRSI